VAELCGPKSTKEIDVRTGIRCIPIQYRASPHRTIVYLSFFFFFFLVVIYLVTIDRQECKYRLLSLSLSSLYALDRYKPSPLISTTYYHHHLCIYVKKKCGFSFSLSLILFPFLSPILLFHTKQE